MIMIYLLFIILILVIIYLLRKSILSKKIIWQKISFLYNKIYKILILDYYKKKQNKKLKEEIIYYYENVVHNNNILVKTKKWNNVKDFIEMYYKYDDLNHIEYILNNIDSFMLKYYKLVSNNINMLLFILIICITIFIVLIVK